MFFLCSVAVQFLPFICLILAHPKACRITAAGIAPTSFASSAGDKLTQCKRFVDFADV